MRGRFVVIIQLDLAGFSQVPVGRLVHSPSRHGSALNLPLETNHGARVSAGVQAPSPDAFVHRLAEFEIDFVVEPDAQKQREDVECVH